MPPAALPGAKLLKSLINRFYKIDSDQSKSKANVIFPEESAYAYVNASPFDLRQWATARQAIRLRLRLRRDMGAKRIRNQLSRWHTLPPEARFLELNSYPLF